MELKQLLNEENNFTHKSKEFSLKKLLTRYIAKVEFEQDKEFFTYLGGVNLNFERNELGIYKYQNGDVFFGNWNKNLKEGMGIFYSFQPFTASPSKLFFNFYIGNWTSNSKNGNGIYLRILVNPESTKNNNFDNSVLEQNLNFTYQHGNFNQNNNSINNSCISHLTKKLSEHHFIINYNEIEKIEIFCGTFKDDDFIEGINYFISENNEEAIYYGKMNENFEKNDPDGILVTRHNKYVYKGNFVDNKFKNGYVFNVNDDISKLFYIEYEEDEIVEYKNKNNVENYENFSFEMIKIYVLCNEIDAFQDIIKYANLTEYYISRFINYDFDAFIDNYEFLREHILYSKDLYNNIMDSLM